MLKHYLKAAVNSNGFVFIVINDERSFFNSFTINNVFVSVATSNNNSHVTK